MVEDLWTEDRIFTQIAALNRGSEDPYDTLIATGKVLRRLRDDLQAALDAANQRIAEQEQEIWKISIHAADQMQRIVELEAQLEWEPITDWWEHESVAGNAKRKTTYNPGNNGIGIEVVYGGGNGQRSFAGENFPSNIRLCRRKEGR